MAMGATVVALAVLCLAINVWNAHLTAERLDGLIELIYENGGIPADKMHKNPQPDGTFQLSPEAPYETRYFIVELGADGLVESIDASHLASVDEAEMTRADEPPDRTTFEEVDLSELVDDAVEGFEPLAEASGRTLARAVDGGVEVRGSTEELERLAGVLLDNAIKYSSERAEVLVTLRTRRHGVSRMAELAVENPCEHLSAEDAAHLFDRFYRADASRSRETGGYGIGLALARAICTRHGGSIGAQVEGGRVTITAVLPMG